MDIAWINYFFYNLLCIAQPELNNLIRFMKITFQNEKKEEEDLFISLKAPVQLHAWTVFHTNFQVRREKTRTQIYTILLSNSGIYYCRLL